MKKNYKTPVVEVVKMTTVGFLAGSPLSLDGNPGFFDGYTDPKDPTFNGDIDL